MISIRDYSSNVLNTHKLSANKADNSGKKYIHRLCQTMSLSFGLIFDDGKLSPANSGRLNFWNYTPLMSMIL